MDPQDGKDFIRVQVKNQRKEKGIPKENSKLSKSYGFPVYVVETQKTRTGKKTDKDGNQIDTRPYSFFDFDILAVCLQPSSGVWEDFIYSPVRNLRPRAHNSSLLEVMQPIIPDGNHGWTRDFDEAAMAVYKMQQSSRS